MNKYYHYSYKNFNKKHEERYLESHIEFVTQIFKIVNPTSVVDFGCGNGLLLNIIKNKGIKDIFGVDGPWVDRKSLKIDTNDFLSHDLQESFNLNRCFDLAISIEVAEHLPTNTSDAFIRTLTQSAPVIVFSAAIPNQGGNKHINEQWPDYWKDLFQKEGYEQIDALRTILWNNPKVKWWLAQNTFIYVKKTMLGNYPILEKYFQSGNPMPLRCIHPKNYLNKVQLSPIKLAYFYWVKVLKKVI